LNPCTLNPQPSNSNSRDLIEDGPEYERYCHAVVAPGVAVVQGMPAGKALLRIRTHPGSSGVGLNKPTWVAG